jgi:malate synthase
MTADGVQILGPVQDRHGEVLTEQAVEFLARLHREFDDRRRELLEARVARQARLNAGEMPEFLADGADVRAGDWMVTPAPDDLLDRRVEITGPTERKMLINAMNSGAQVYMADFEDANAPTWQNMLDGHVNLSDAIDRKVDFTTEDGKEYSLNEEVATLVVRPRGWHLLEKHFVVDGRPISGSLFDFGLYLFHCGHKQLEAGSGPYFYLPKIESRLEARLWNDVFVFAQEQVGMTRGTIRATVLVETILAAFEMDEILFELREHSPALNAGRWDYIFSIIKRFRAREDLVFPDRNDITMTVPFMRAYTELLVRTCHRRGAHAIGGMAAFIPSRKNPEINENALAKVRDDKERESSDGFDGTWVAHPDLVPVAKEVFDSVLGDRPNQLEVLRDDVAVAAKDLLRFEIAGRGVSEGGLRSNISVAILYIESWLRGVGAAALFNLMEDAATAEIARSQVWQWISRRATLEDGRTIDRELVETFEEEELEKIQSAVGDDAYFGGRFKDAQAVFERVSMQEDFEEFLTLPAYELLD